DWAGFVTAAAGETVKAAAGEYQQAIVGGRIAQPVEYQDARGSIFHAERLIESVAPDLEKKDAAALRAVRAGFAELKKAFPAPMPPRAPVKEHGALLADVSRSGRAAGRLVGGVAGGDADAPGGGGVFRRGGDRPRCGPPHAPSAAARRG